MRNSDRTELVISLGLGGGLGLLMAGLFVWGVVFAGCVVGIALALDDDDEEEDELA